MAQLSSVDFKKMLTKNRGETKDMCYLDSKQRWLVKNIGQLAEGIGEPFIASAAKTALADGEISTTNAHHLAQFAVRHQ